MATINIGSCGCCGGGLRFNGRGFYILKVVYDFTLQGDVDEGFTPVLSGITPTYAATAPFPAWSRSWLGIGDQFKNGLQVEDGEDNPELWVAFSTLDDMQAAPVPRSVPALGTPLWRLNLQRSCFGISLTAPFELPFTDRGGQYLLTIPAGTEFYNGDFQGARQSASTFDEDDYLTSATYYYCYELSIESAWVARTQ